MKKSAMKRLVGGALTGLMCLSVLPAIPAAPELKAYALQQKDSKDGYDYELWSEYNDNVSMTNGANGTFSCSWQNSHNCLFRAGKKWSNSPKWSSLNGIAVDYEVDYHPNGNSYLCIYGWTRNPLVEYYIVDSYGTWRPPGQGFNMKGNINVDNASYEVYAGTHDGPSIDQGVTHFNQYWSVRAANSLRTKGTIHVDQHFAAWEKFGMTMGGMYEVALNVEGWESSGQATVKLNKLTLGGGGSGDDPTITEPVEPKKPSDGTNYFKSGFESSKDNWAGRGDASVTTDTSNYYSGKSSLYVTGRQDNWHGAAITLDPDYFVPGATYSFSAAVLQKSGAATNIKMTIQQGSDEYHEVATVKAASGEWTKIENVEFTIPSGSTDLILYLEAPDSLTNFYIDDVVAAVKGTKSSVTTGGGTVAAGSTVDPGTTDPGSSDPVNTSDAQLKQVFAKYFRIGTAVSSNEVNTNGSFVKKHFNSITPENELKPQWIFDKQASASSGSNTNPQVKLPYDTKQILDFAVKNNIPMRGHTLVWHSQTDLEFFRENFSSNGQFVSKDIMNQRIDNYIKNVFAMLKENYPTLKLYAYDVANECFRDGNPGGLREAGTNQNGGQSPWMMIYGDDSFLETAFTSARKYAPSDCKLFYNDYNEYENPKMENIYNLVKKLYSKGILDGVGMQSHLDTGYPSASQYKTALEKYASIGCEIHVTELDVTCSNESTQASYYENIVKAIRDCDAVTSLTFWGTNDSMSWRRSQNPLLFKDNQPKQAFNKIVALVPSSEWKSDYVEPGSSDPGIQITPTTEAPTQPQTQPQTDPGSDLPTVTKFGDADNNGDVKMNDAVLVMQALSNSDKFGLNGTDDSHIKKQGASNADVYQHGDGLTAKDALTIQNYLLGNVGELPVSYAEKKNNDVTTTKAKTTTAQATTTVAQVNTDGFFTEGFESGKGVFAGRGGASVATDSDNYYDGSKSLKVSGRTDGWNGAETTLDTSTFKAGNTYSFSAAVMHAAGSAQSMKMTLQYTADGKEQYDEIASASVPSKTWTKLENKAYTIPEGATDLILYVEMPDDSYADFFIDSAVAAAQGTSSKVTNGGGTVNIKEPEITPGTVDPSKPMIAISFDDGASPSNNKRIVDALSKQGFHATFFYIGNKLGSADAQNEVKYAYSKGMEIANHSMTHPYLGKLSSSEIRSEVDGCQQKLKEILGVDTPKLIRLPYLDSTGAVKSTLTDYGLVTCAIDTGDWNRASTNDIVNKIKSAMSNGSGNGAIVLCHETEGNTVAAIEELAPYIKAQGWQVVTISEMYAAKGKSIPYGQIMERVS